MILKSMRPLAPITHSPRGKKNCSIGTAWTNNPKNVQLGLLVAGNADSLRQFFGGGVFAFTIELKRSAMQGQFNLTVEAVYTVAPITEPL